MSEHNSNNIERIKKTFDDCADKYDEWCETFEGAVGYYVDWELLKKYLPKNKNAKILDAAGGTGRITLPLAKLGYDVTLCDISPKMLDVARRKMLREGVTDRVKIVECDVQNLGFSDDSFDFVLCWGGPFEATKELTRVTKKGGGISIFPVNKWGAAVNDFYENLDSTLSLIESSPSYLEDEHGKYWAVSPEEAIEFVEAAGIRVIDIYGAWGWMDLLRIPKEVHKSRDWNDAFFQQTIKLVLTLSKEPSVIGITRHLVIYGEKM
jgi:ubiquinone/menaquinone biosynthesis C-methylase UbiE